MYLNRGGKKPLCLSRRVNGKPKKIYVGTGPLADLLAAELEARKQARKAAAHRRDAWTAGVRAADDPLDSLCAQLDRLVAAPSLAAAEAATLHLAKMRRELGEDSAPPLEKLLIARVALCRLACHSAEIDRGELLKAADKRVDRAHARLLSATRALAIVRKLGGPALPRLALLRVPECEPQSGTGRPLPASPHQRRALSLIGSAS